MTYATRGDQFQTEIRKTSSRCPRSVDDAELVELAERCCFEEDGKGIQRFLMHVLSYCFAHETFC